jgi:hypothetical protein
MTRYSFCVAVLAGIAMLGGCDFPPPTQPIVLSDLFGHYVGDFGETDVNYFDLFEDSTYISYYKTKDGHLYVDTGFWRFVKWEDKYTVNYWLDMYEFHPLRSGSILKIKKANEWKDAFADNSRIRRFGLSKRHNEIEVEYSFRAVQYYEKKSPPDSKP